MKRITVAARIAMIVTSSFMGLVYGLAAAWVTAEFYGETQAPIVATIFVITLIVGARHEYRDRAQEIYQESSGNLFGAAMMVLAIYGAVLALAVHGAVWAGMLVGLAPGAGLQLWHQQLRRPKRLVLRRVA